MNSIKRGKWERRAARQVSAPPPEETLANVQSGVDVNRGSSDQIPLSDVGQQQAEQMADKLQEKGGLDKLIVSPAVRTEQTAQPIIARNPQIPVKSDPNLESWAQGNLEGQPQAQVKNEIRDLIRRDPRRVLPGQGAMTSKPGESFDQFRLRALPAMRGIMQEYAEGAQQNPSHKIGVPIHSQVIKLTKAWLKNGAPDDFSIDPKEMDHDSEAPGTVARMFPNENGEWEINDINLDNGKQLDPGIYLIRHALTPQNRETYERSEQQHKALANLVQSTQGLKFPTVKQWAQKASKTGMPDEEIGNYIDQSLPDANSAAGMSMPQILAVMAAASPKKRQEYLPLIASHFGNLDALPEDQRRLLEQHIANIQNAV